MNVPHPYRKPRPGIVLPALVVCAALILGACDNAVDPFSPRGSQDFAVFGFLDTAADTQYVRVARVQHDAAMLEDVELRPMVSTTNLANGVRTAWEDSAVVLEDGSRGLLHFAAFSALPGVTYRIEISDDPASSTRGFTTVPVTELVQVGMPRRDAFDALQQEIVWRDVGPPAEVALHYRVRALPTRTESTVTVPYVDVGSSSTVGWRVNVMLHRDFGTVRRRVQAAVGDTALVLLDVGMSFDVPSIEWMDVDEASNIDNGTGFFASVGRFFGNWSLDSTTVRAIGYRTP